MSCGPVSAVRSAPLPKGLFTTLGDEGFRLFFPLSAFYAALFPLLWVLAWGFDLPLAKTVPPSLWHAHEMLIGAFGAALIGFITTAAPEWTDTPPPRGRPLWTLAALWGIGRCVGLFGWDAIGIIGAFADLTWMIALTVWLIFLSWQRHTDRLIAFVFWVVILTACLAIVRFGFWNGDVHLAQQGVHLVGFAFLGLLGLALSRITVPVTNLILDPTERTSPFRPHPGRLHLAPGLIMVAMIGQIMGFSETVSAWLVVAAGAAFMDRVGEAFIGRDIVSAEILMIAGSSALAGGGLLLAGAAMLGAPWPEVAGLHIALMGGLGLGVYAVFCIAGLLHTGHTLGLTVSARIGAIVLIVSTAMRVAPDFGYTLAGPTHAIASFGWATAFMIWINSFWRLCCAKPPDRSNKPL